MKRYMVVERIRPGSWDAVYARFAAQGRLLPDGLTYVASWPSRDASLCFQLMETSDPALFDVWIARWSDLVAFDIHPLDDPSQ